MERLSLGLRTSQWGGGSHHDTPIVNGVPRVLQSNIGNAQPDGIVIIWDRAMMVSGDISSQITVLVDTSPVTVNEIVFHPDDKRIMGVLVTPEFKYGQTITWAYDDSGAFDIHQIESPQTEADNQTYDVFNDLHAPRADNNYIKADSDKFTADSEI